MKGRRTARLSPALVALWLVGFVAHSGPHGVAHHDSARPAAHASSSITASTPAAADVYTPFDTDGVDIDDHVPEVLSSASDTPLTQLTVNHLFENHEWPCVHPHWPTLSARGPPAV